MSKHFSGKPVQFVMATQTYGYFRDQAALTGQQEAALDAKYFLEEHELPMTLAISDQPKGRDSEGRLTSTMPSNDQAYHVTGIPQTVLIDKLGVVRAVFVGADPANEKLIQTLLSQMQL